MCFSLNASNSSTWFVKLLCELVRSVQVKTRWIWQNTARVNSMCTYVHIYVHKYSGGCGENSRVRLNSSCNTNPYQVFL